MRIVQVALQRPHTFIVLALLIVLLGVFTILRIPIDIFPNINIPVIAAIWSYTGLSPDDMSKRIILLSEKSAQTAVLFRSADLQVAVVGADHHVTLKNITTGRDFGTSMEVLSGVGAGDNVIVNPPDSITSGALVRVAQPQPLPQPPSPLSAQHSAPGGSGQS